MASVNAQEVDSFKSSKWVKLNTEAHEEVGGSEVRVLEVEATGGRQDREATQQHASAQLRPAAVHHGRLETGNKPTAGAEPRVGALMDNSRFCQLCEQ